MIYLTGGERSGKVAMLSICKELSQKPMYVATEENGMVTFKNRTAIKDRDRWVNIEKKNTW
jgi:adenosyl cobinamide kinase/adenosyl cobinamide phosphate guanylyltransferase